MMVILPRKMMMVILIVIMIISQLAAIWMGVNITQATQWAPITHPWYLNSQRKHRDRQNVTSCHCFDYFNFFGFHLHHHFHQVALLTSVKLVLPVRESVSNITSRGILWRLTSNDYLDVKRRPGIFSNILLVVVLCAARQLLLGQKSALWVE